MKKIIVYFFVFAVFTVSCKQPSKNNKNVVDSTTVDKTIKSKKLSVLLPSDIQVSNIKLSENSKDLNRIGHADSIITVKSDFDIPDLRRYYIRQSYFEIDTDKTIYGFDIVDSSFVLKPFDIKVGDKMQNVVNKLNSYIDDEMSNLKENTLKVRIGSSDDYLSFSFKNGLLSEYETWSDE
jgi:hypothetical protein